MNAGSPWLSMVTNAIGVLTPSSSANQSSATPSAASRSRTHAPQASLPAPPASAPSAPRRAAVTAALATSPPNRGTNASAWDDESTACSQTRSTSTSPRHRVRMRGNGILRRSVAEVSEQRGLVGEAEVFWQEAPGLPVLYLHGVPTDGDDWLPFLEQTGGFAPDLPGFGRSSKRGDLDFSMEGLGRFAEDFANARGLDRMSLVVHDWGAAGLLFAMRAPERVERLVIIDAIPFLSGYRWHRIARVWRRRGAGELFMGATSARGIATLAPDLKPRARVVAERFDQGTQRAVLR